MSGRETSNGTPENAGPPGRRLPEVWHSSIGKRVIVGITGVILALYVVLHALGNLKAFRGTGDGGPPIDRCAEWLRAVGRPMSRGPAIGVR